jgi:uroporphyrinogen decarboxylase
MGMELEFVPGPRFRALIRMPEEARALRVPSFGPGTDVCRCLGATRGAVGDSAGVLGFIGAPFTVASFAIAPGASDREDLSSATTAKAETFRVLQERLAGVLVGYGAAQAAAGADTIQVFESLAGSLPAPEYRRVGLPWLIQTVEALRHRASGVPVIVFGRGLWPFVPELARAGAASISLDHSRRLPEARLLLGRVGEAVALQGNLDPEVLRRTPAVAADAARGLLDQWREIVPQPERSGELGPSGWVFNLGHGVPADADPDSVAAVVGEVKSFRFQEPPP